MKKFLTGLLAAFLSLGCEYPGESSFENADVGTASVEFLDVGQALSVLFRADGLSALYDAGGDSSGFWDSLGSRNVRHLDFALVSHWHRDHVGGLLEWDGSVGIDTLFYGADTGGFWLKDSVLKLAKKFRTEAVEVERGRRLPCGLWNCTVLWPSEYGPFGGNGASVVLQISDGDFRTLLTGDLEAAGERALMALSGDLSAELLQVGHHGSGTSSSLAFLERVAPKIAVVSVGKGNSYGHPSAETLAKLALFVGDSSSILRTDREGTVRMEWKFRKGIWRKP